MRGFILYVLGAPVSWQSKLQKSVSLSSSDAEYVALSEAIKELVFIIQHLGGMKISVNYAVMVTVENVDAIFMASNITTACQTKHFDIRYNINKYVEDRLFKIIFHKSADNDCSILTKSLSTELHEKHSKKMVSEKP